MNKGDRRAWYLPIIVFAGLVLLFGPETQTLAIGTHSGAERWTMGCSRVALMLLCVMPTYFLATGLISVFRGKAADSFRRALPDAEAHTGMAPKMAVLYTTRNDFHEAAVDRLLGIGYGNCGVFLCDDSTVPHWRQQVDEWVQTERGGEKWKVARTGDNDTESAEPSNTQ